jgi:hypothetical protein
MIMDKISRLYRDDAGNLIESTAGNDDAVVQFTRQGGGFVQEMARADFDRTFKPAQISPMHDGWVSGDWLPEGTVLPAILNDARWNGWAIPYFELETARKLAYVMSDLRYDVHRDAFVTESGEGGDEEVFVAEKIVVAGRERKAYAIGAGSWCWCEESAPARRQTLKP